MLHLLFPVVICISAAIGVWIILIKSPLVVHLLEHYIEDGEFFTHKDVEDWLLEGNRWFLHGVWTCPVCQAVWTSALAALLLFFATLSFWGLILWPITFLCFLPVILWIQKRL